MSMQFRVQKLTISLLEEYGQSLAIRITSGRKKSQTSTVFAFNLHYIPINLLFIHEAFF